MVVANLTTTKEDAICPMWPFWPHGGVKNHRAKLTWWFCLWQTLPQALLFSSFQSWTCFHLNNTPQKGLRNSFLGSFFLCSAPQAIPRQPLILSPSWVSEQLKLVRKNPEKQGFPKQFFPLTPPLLPFCSPHAIPMEIPHKTDAGRLEIPAFLSK